ncbi:phage tail protein [Sphingomonas sp. HMWF008]|nr:phage tail protein [Sphingomonas sp. HMWF008]
MSDAYIGEIRVVAFGAFRQDPPVGWLPCDGRAVSVNDYQILFALIGTTYGGNGVSTFRLPNLNGSVPVFQGQGQGLSPRIIGQSGGADNVTVTVSQMPAHTHNFSATTATNTTGTMSGTVLYGSEAAPTYKRYLSPIPTPAPTLAQFADDTISATGGNTPHNNLMPGIGLRYIICVTAGLFPERN